MKTISTSDGICTGRNGTVNIRAIELTNFGNLVRIDGVSKAKGVVLDAGMSFDREAARNLMEALREILDCSLSTAHDDLDDLHEQNRHLMRKGSEIERCEYCLRPIDDCECCDADVDAEMGAKG